MSSRNPSKNDTKDDQSTFRGSGSAVSRVKDLKAKILGAKAKKEESPKETPLSTPKSTVSVPSSERGDARLRPPPTSADSSKPRIATMGAHSALLESQINSGIQAKLDLAEDKALTNLAKRVCQYISDPSVGSDASLAAIVNYEIRELQQITIHSQNSIETLEKLGFKIQTLLNAAMSLQDSISSATDQLEHSLRAKRQRFEYNAVAKQILQLTSKDDSVTTIAHMENTIHDLKNSNDYIARVVELRRRQMGSILDWVNVLETGRR